MIAAHSYNREPDERGCDMSKVMKNIKLIMSPFNENVDSVGNLILSVFVPYSEKDVTLKINPNIVHHADQPANNIRKVSVQRDTNDTKTLKFDFANSNVHEVDVQGKKYEIKLMNIGTVNEEGQDFKSFEFFVTEL